jgi:hypothetical protein
VRKRGNKSGEGGIEGKEREGERDIEREESELER